MLWDSVESLVYKPHVGKDSPKLTWQLYLIHVRPKLKYFFSPKLASLATLYTESALTYNVLALFHLHP